MAWTYLDWDAEEGYDSEQLPPAGSAYLAFDTLTGRVVIGYRERGGYSSYLGPNVKSDCSIAAWAPLDEATDPDLTRIQGWDGTPYYRDSWSPQLIRHATQS